MKQMRHPDRKQFRTTAWKQTTISADKTEHHLPLSSFLHFLKEKSEQGWHTVVNSSLLLASFFSSNNLSAYLSPGPCILTHIAASSRPTAATTSTSDVQSSGRRPTLRPYGASLGTDLLVVNPAGRHYITFMSGTLHIDMLPSALFSLRC